MSIDVNAVEVLEQIEEELDTAMEEGEKFEEGKLSAALKIRKSLMTIINKAKQLRKDIQDAKNQEKEWRKKKRDKK